MGEAAEGSLPGAVGDRFSFPPGTSAGVNVSPLSLMVPPFSFIQYNTGKERPWRGGECGQRP